MQRLLRNAFRQKLLMLKRVGKSSASLPIITVQLSRALECPGGEFYCVARRGIVVSRPHIYSLV